MFNKEKKEKRFQIIQEESMTLGFSATILLDTVTGVQYLYTQSGYGGGLSPLLDADGRPLRWRPPVEA